MSPASQGAIGVERYIGSCLVQKSPRPMPKQHYGHGVLPMAAPNLGHRNPQRTPPVQNNRIPLSRLAVHTQGAPLILPGRFNNNRHKNYQGNSPNNPTQPTRPNRPEQQKSQQQPAADGASIDALSVASDESSGSNNSENSLPRIIKPRKRRKKDRKPPANPQNPTNTEQTQQITSSVALKPQPATTNNVNSNAEAQNIIFKNVRKPQQQQQNNNTRQVAQVQSKHVHVKVLDDNRNIVVPVLRNHLINNGYVCEFKEPTDSVHCQCQHCDAGNFLWEADYLPPAALHHHHHHHHPVFLARPYTLCHEHCDLESSNCMRFRDRDSAAILRRSWSDPSSYFTDDIIPNRDVGVIGDRGHSDFSKDRSTWRGDAATAINLQQQQLSSSLEVSTEIVTSPNGQRDLEIKFYSSSPSNNQVSDEDSNSKNFSFPEDEEYNDIWSYHENKLQQDFRTLLQAEE